MTRRSKGIRVPKTEGEKTIILATKLNLLDRMLEIRKDKHFVYIPLLCGPSKNALKNLTKEEANAEISTYSFSERRKQAPSLSELLNDKLSSRLLSLLPHSADIVGDIATIEIAPELEAYKYAIGEAFLKANKNLRTVLAKAGSVGGTYRLRDFNVIAGEPRTLTIHKEYGCRYYVDVAKAYFSPRLSYEHNRVASMVREGEIVVDLFAGVGPFAVLIAKTHKNVRVYAVDVNPYAIELMKRNIRFNRVENKVTAVLGDAKQAVDDRFLGKADRVIMNLPERAMEFVDVACKTLKPTGGVVHFYSFIGASFSLQSTKSGFSDAVERHGRRLVRVLSSRAVRPTAPHEWQGVLDGRIV